MESSLEVAQSLLNIGAAALFSCQPSTLNQVEFALASREFHGLAVSSVSEMDIRQRDTLPLLLAARLTSVRDWETPLADNLALLVFDHVSATMRAAKPFDDSTRNRPDMGRPATKRPRPLGAAATVVGSSVRCLDSRKLLGIPLRAGRVTLLAMSYDWVSNTFDVDLVDGSPSPSLKPRDVNPEPRPDGKGMPSYEPTAGVQPPAQSGLAFELGVGGSDSSVVVRGSLVTAALMRHIPGSPTTAGGQRVSAVIPLTMIIAGRNWKTPWLFEWGIPVLGARPAEVGSTVKAQFSIALPEERVRLLGPGEYAAYMVMEGVVFGPQKFTVPLGPR